MMNGMMNGANGICNGAVNGLYSGGMFGFPFSALIFAGLVILVVYLLFRNKKQASNKELIFKNEKSLPVDATEIVRLRYARGEISLEEFQTIIKNIQS